MKRHLKISSKHQITLPVRLLEELNVAAGDRLEVTSDGRHVVLTPMRRSIVEQTAGSLRPYISPDKLGTRFEEVWEETQQLAAEALAEEGVER